MDQDKTEAREQPPGASPNNSGAAQLNSRLDQAYCADRARLLFGCYRRDDANDADIYCSAITLVLSDYPRAVVEFVTDPRAGIPARYKFPPSAAEVKEACDAEMARAVRMAQPVSRIRPRDYVPPRADPGCRANVFVHADAPQYAIVKAWSESKEADERDWKLDDRGRAGVWVSLSIYENIAGGRIRVGVGKNWQSPSDAAMRAEYGRREAEAKAAAGEEFGP
jgi:hypothetical protein